MRVLVLGGDGYLGWPTAVHLSDRGHTVAVADNFARRGYDHELGVDSLVPVEPLGVRVRVWAELSGRPIETFCGDLTDAGFTRELVQGFGPEAVVHFAEQRSAPYSMIDQAHAVYTQRNNVLGTLNLLFAIAETDPDIHLVKLGTMGEYGTPNIDIEEGWLDRRAQRAHRPDALPEAARILLPPLEGARQPQHRVRLPGVGAAGHRPQPGRGVRPADPGDRGRPAAGNQVGLRLDLRHGAQPVLSCRQCWATRSPSTVRAARPAA